MEEEDGVAAAAAVEDEEGGGGVVVVLAAAVVEGDGGVGGDGRCVCPCIFILFIFVKDNKYQVLFILYLNKVIILVQFYHSILHY